MNQLLSSKSALEELCKAMPPSDISYGILKTIGGTALAAGSGASGVGVYAIYHFWERFHDTMSKVVEYGGIALCGAIGIGLLAGGAYFIADGISSICKKKNFNAGSIAYYRNGGYTMAHTWSDRKFGTPVVPVESAGELSKMMMPKMRTDYKLCINGLAVAGTDLKSERKSRRVSTGQPGQTRTEYYTLYTVTLDSTLHDEPVNAFLSTTSKASAEQLVSEKGNELFIMGNINDNKIKIDKYEAAYVSL